MRNPINSRVGTVVAAAAVLAVFGGGTAAVASGLVTSRDIKDGTIRHADVHPQTLKSGDISRDGVGMSEIRKDAVGQSEVAAGAVGWGELTQYVRDRINSDGAVAGPAGPQGEKGEKGDTGAPGTNGTNGKDGVSGYEPANAEVRWAPGGATETVAACPTGKVALGGGYEIDGTANGSAAGTEIVDNGPTYANGVATGWRVAGVPDGQVNVKAWTICATVG